MLELNRTEPLTTATADVIRIRCIGYTNPLMIRKDGKDSVYLSEENITKEVYISREFWPELIMVFQQLLKT